MKIYAFYLHSKIIDPSEFRGVDSELIIYENKNYEYALYAFTPMKEIRDIFVNTRDMSIFFEKVIEIPREDYEEFCDGHDPALLDIHGMKTSCDVDGVIYPTCIPVLCTTYEADSILYYKYDILEDLLLVPSENGNVWKGLNHLKYSYRKLLDKRYPLGYLLYQLDCPREMLNLPGKFELDEVALFAHLFRNTFKQKGSRIPNEGLEILRRFYSNKS
jgi:hypothetical protein